MILLLWLSCSPKAGLERLELPPEGQLPPGRLVIAHTNDIHSHFLPFRAEWRADEAPLGGMLALDTSVRALRRRNGERSVLFLDAGDVLTGTPLMELEERGVAGGGMAALFQAIGVQAWALGNHELDRGFDHAAAFVGLSASPVLSANVRAPCGDAPLECGPGLPGTQAAQIFEVNGLRVGVFGLTTASLPHLTDAGTMARLRVVDHESAARRMVAELEPQVDLVVALTHIGLEADRELVRRVQGIDLVVGGHSHTRLETAEKVEDSYIVQAGSYGRLLGVVELAVAGGRITELRYQLRELDPERFEMPPDPRVKALVQDYEARVEARFSRVLGHSSQTLARSPGPLSPLGAWAAESVRKAAEADIGITNSGGLRADLVAGPITEGSLYQIFPFGNELVTFPMSGAEVLDLCLRVAGGILDGNRSVPQVAGLGFDWRVRLGAPELVQVRVGGEPLDLTRTYRVATNAFVASQWQRNLGFQPREVQRLPMTELQANIERVEQEGVSVTETRQIRRID